MKAKENKLSDNELENVNGGNAIDQAEKWIDARGKIIEEDLKGDLTFKKAGHIAAKGLGTGIGIVSIGLKGAADACKKGVKKVLDLIF